MKKVFKHWLRIYNDFSKGDRNAIIILGSLILIVNIGIIVVNNLNPKSKYDYTQYEKLLDDLKAPEKNIGYSKKSFFTFNPNTITSDKLDTLDLPDFIKNNLVSYRKAGGRYSSLSDVRKIYGMNDSIFEEIKSYILIDKQVPEKKIKVEKQKNFEGIIDPGIADYDELVEFGFNSFQSNNIIQYREKGGLFNQKTDLLKIYGIDTAFYKLIENHILIETDNEPLLKKVEHVLINVELNKADTTELKKLNGIGSVYANRIIKYRDLLGGFYSVEQILEVYNLPEETFKKIEPELSVDTLLVKKIRINFAEYADLLRHPYLKKSQVETLLNYRNQKGAYKNIEQLKLEGLLDSETFRKISPYLTCR